ncbi:UvrD-helicase domain-containing protein [Patescibacteria group bacterium]|nr:UvrD-helicase domain-containing protein [Patescibacteria group bacterium]
MADKNNIMSNKLKTQKLLKGLNQAQAQAVKHTKGPLLIIAGPGTGKTMVITKKIAWLILNKQASADNILALTFTDKASQEMEERVDKILPYGYVDLWISTFHSFCQRILDDNGTDIGLPLKFTLLNSVQQAFLILDNFDKFELDYYKPLGNPTKFVREMTSHFSRLKDESISPADYLKYAATLELNKDSVMSDEALDVEVARIKEIAKAYHAYQQLLLDNNFLDFGDLINYTIKLFKQRPHILKKYQQQFKYILVDEFQDTNYAQYELVKLLSAPKNNITVVSDGDQGIYRWRGASYNNVIQFKQDFSALKQVILTTNYRTKQNILDMAYKFIQLNNPNRLEAQDKTINKKLTAKQAGQGEINYTCYQSQTDEVYGTIEKIISLKKQNPKTSWNDFAILVRTNAQAEQFCSALRSADISHQYLARTGLFSKPVIMDILSYLKLLDNYHESPAIYRILISPIFSNKIKNEDLINLMYFARRKNLSLYETIKNSANVPKISVKTVEQLKHLLSWIEKHTQMAKTEPVSKIVRAFLNDSGYARFLIKLADKKEEQSVAIISYLNQFLKKIASFEASNTDKSIANFSRIVELMIATGDVGSISSDDQAGPESVKVSTIHSAKGLEWQWVFITNLADKRFPTINRKEPIEIPEPLIKEIIPIGDIHIEEERRLFYVALTRAKQGLYLSFAENYGGKLKKKKSRFLTEIGFDKEIKAKTYNQNDFFQPTANIKASKEKFELPLPTKFSFSQFEGFKNCPLQYKFSFLLKIPRAGKFVFSFGKTMHDTLDKFLKQWLKEKNNKQSNLFSKPGKGNHSGLSLKNLLNIYEKIWIDDWYDSQKHAEEFKQSGKEQLKMFYNNFIKTKPNVKYLEQGIYFKIKNYSIIGKIDRVDEIKGGFEIIDYKTGNPKKIMSAKDKEQLFIYQLACEALPDKFDKPIKQLTFYYLKDGSRVSFQAKPAELDEMRLKIISIIDKIKQQHFPPQPSQLCKYCDFKGICEYRY